MRAIKTEDLQDATNVLHDAFWALKAKMNGTAEIIGQGDPRFKEIHDIRLKVKAAMVKLGRNDKATREKGKVEPPPSQCVDLTTPCFFRKIDESGAAICWGEEAHPMNCQFSRHAAPPDPYGGKVLDDGRIEYVTISGKTARVNPLGEAWHFKRGDLLEGKTDSEYRFLGTIKYDGYVEAWVQKIGRGNIATCFRAEDERFFRLKARNPQEIRNPYMAGLVEGGYPC